PGTTPALTLPGTPAAPAATTPSDAPAWKGELLMDAPDSGEACSPGGAGPCCNGVCGPPGRFWLRAEYLLWWTRSLHVPPRVSTRPAGSPVGQAGVLGAPGTAVLLGNGDFFDRVRSGGRLTAGAWLDHEQTIGVEGYFFGLEGLADHFTAASDGVPILARPFFNAQTGNGDALLIAFPGSVRGNTTINV